jgi:two-component system chemotaxis response regulator CheY
MRALVIEDSSTIRLILCRYLQKMNIEVTEAVDGQVALVRLKAMSPPDVILVDWNMPVMSGLDFVRELRRMPVYDRVPVIMITTNSEGVYLSTALEAGANEYIQKPCTYDVLREKLDQMGILNTTAQ